MYLELFKLHELPFRLSPDPQFLYLSKQHARAKAYMESTIWFTDGFVVITGEIGAGKTTLIETFLRELQADVVVAQINQTQLSPTAFLQTVLVQFGFTPFNMKKPEVLSTLNQFLTEQHLNGHKVLLIVDEAQNLSYRVLEEIRMLSGHRDDQRKGIANHLGGATRTQRQAQFKGSRSAYTAGAPPFPLAALTAAETAAYIEHRLEVAGSQGRRIFGEDIYPSIYKYYRRRASPDQHPLRHVHDGCIRPGQRFGHRAGPRGRDRRIAVGEFAAGTNRMRIAQWDQMPSPQSGGGTTGRPDIARTQGKTVLERELKPGRLVIGRTPDNDLQIDSKFISRHHCQIVTQPDSCLIEDLNSTNGIFVKSKRVRRHNLNDGDVVQVGQHEIMYIDERPSRSRQALDAADPAGPQEARDKDEE